MMNLHEQREINQFNLATLYHDAYNRFDLASDQIIEQLKKENKQAFVDHDAMERMKNEDHQKWMELQEQADRMDINLDHQMNGYIMDTIYRTEEMVAMMEMKIIYAFKHLEINIKKLITAAYPNTNTKDFYRWDVLNTFLKSKGIQPQTLEGYNEVMQLKDVNNNVKHKEAVQPAVQAIAEFKDLTHVTFESLEAFYNRIKFAPETFLKALSLSIYKEVYDFDEGKLKALAESIILRLNKKEALQLVQLITASYQ